MVHGSVSLDALPLALVGAADLDMLAKNSEVAFDEKRGGISRAPLRGDGPICPSGHA